MTERQFQTRFTRWARHHITETCACELKVSKKKRMPLSQIADHQWTHLKNTKHKKLLYKIPDVGYDQKPFDFFCLHQESAYLVVLFYLERGDNKFYMIDIDDLIFFKEAGNKSMTVEDADILATRVGYLKT